VGKSPEVLLDAVFHVRVEGLVAKDAVQPKKCHKEGNQGLPHDYQAHEVWVRRGNWGPKQQMEKFRAESKGGKKAHQLLLPACDRICPQNESRANFY
jgi:hypothetical protein